MLSKQDQIRLGQLRKTLTRLEDAYYRRVANCYEPSEDAQCLAIEDDMRNVQYEIDEITYELSIC